MKEKKCVYLSPWINFCESLDVFRWFLFGFTNSEQDKEVYAVVASLKPYKRNETKSRVLLIAVVCV